LTGNHTVSGNPARYVHGIVPIREDDDEWRSRMPMRQRIAVTVATLPGLVRYGYGLGGVSSGMREPRSTR
jgi:hypothetical protein